MIREGSLNGRPRRKRSWIRLKIAVFAPMPRVRVRTESNVNAGDFRSCRSANRMSVNIFLTVAEVVTHIGGQPWDRPGWRDAREQNRKRPRPGLAIQTPQSKSSGRGR